MGLQTNRIIKIIQILDALNQRGSLCMLGVQYIHIDWDDFLAKAKKFNINYDEDMLSKIYGRYPIDSYCFFEMLGFSEVHALDASDYEGADIIHDLNKECNEKYRNQFDVILDGGTLEHVFDIANAMRSLHCMLKKGGIIINLSPLAGYIDHGFYSISPTFFLDWYGANGYLIYSMQIEFVLDKGEDKHGRWQSLFSMDCRLFSDWLNNNNTINEYVEKVSITPGVGRMVLWSVARKETNTEDVIIPMQSMWKQF